MERHLARISVAEYFWLYDANDPDGLSAPTRDNKEDLLNGKLRLSVVGLPDGTGLFLDTGLGVFVYI